jgi:hypothetical protein
MSTRSALAGAAATLVLAGVLGSPAAQDKAADDGAPLLTRTVTALPSWDVPDGAPARLVWGIVLRLAVLLVVALGLSAVAGRSRSRGAAFLAGWGGLVVAAGLAGAVGFVYTVAAVLDGGTLGDVTGDGVVAAVNSGIGFGAWTGWVVGLAVAIATRTEPAEVFAEDYTAEYPAHAAPAAAGTPRRITDPPAPWWAPTAATSDDGTVVRPGPSVFPAGGMPPVVAGVEPGEPLQVVPPASGPPPDEGATRELTTASGDPHPSDPDATQAVGIPDAAPEAEVDDPDATTTIPEATTDPTREMPRRTD